MNVNTLQPEKSLISEEEITTDFNDNVFDLPTPDEVVWKKKREPPDKSDVLRQSTQHQLAERNVNHFVIYEDKDERKDQPCSNVDTSITMIYIIDYPNLEAQFNFLCIIPNLQNRQYPSPPVLARRAPALLAIRFRSVLSRASGIFCGCQQRLRTLCLRLMRRAALANRLDLAWRSQSHSVLLMVVWRTHQIARCLTQTNQIEGPARRGPSPPARRQKQ